MTSIRILHSPNAAERLEAAVRFAESFDPATELLLIGATREAVDDFARELSTRRGATFGLHRFSITQLAARLALGTFAEREIAPATPLAIEALAARVTFETLERDELEYFAPVARFPGFARSLAATVHDLRSAGVPSDRLKELATAGPDLNSLLKGFETRLEEAGLGDRTVLFDTALGTLNSGRSAFFAGWPILLLDVPLESAIERKFARAIAQISSGLLATIPAGDDRTLAAFEGLPGAQPLQPRRTEAHGPIARLQEFLFSLAEPPKLDSSGEPENNIVFFSAPGEGRECIEIARRVLEEARRGVRFDRMAILLRAPETYSGLLESALRRADIPAYFARGTKLPDPSGRAFLALLSCAAERLSARRFAEYLSLAQVPAADASASLRADAPLWVPAENEALGPAGEQTTEVEVSLTSATSAPLDHEDPNAPVVAGSLRTPWNWERLLVEASVIGGKERWQRRLGGLRAQWQLKLAELRAEEPDSARTQAVARDLQNLEHLRQFALPVIEELASFPQNAVWGEWLTRLERLAPAVLRRPARVLAVLAEMRPMAEVGPAPIEEVCDVLADRLTLLEQPPPPRRFGRIFVSTADQIRGRSFETVFIPGLAERVFPQKLREDPLLLDESRAKLGVDLDKREQRAEEERLRLRLGVGAASARLYLSYPRLELGESRPRVPSFYALDIQRAMTGRVPDYKELEREAFRAAGARLAWPAPLVPERAIDTMEHDLAVLGRLLRNPKAGEVQGRARYLLELNTHLARSLRMRHMRWTKTWSGYDGLYPPPQAGGQTLAPYRLRARPYSVSALQKFAACPYQFLLSAIYRLEPREEPVPLERMDPLTRGHLFHRVQAELMRELKWRNSLPLTAESLAPASQALDQVLDRVAADYYEELAPAIERVWKDEIELLRAELRGWLGRAVETQGLWEPILFEFGFGLPGQSDLDPESRTEPVTLEGGWKLHGVVDMIERRRNQDELRVTDHKTGKNRTLERMIVGGGEVLQPVLYGFAVEASLGLPVVESRLFYCTSSGGFTERTVTMTALERRAGIQVLEIVDRALEQGLLLPAPRARACAWCDFREVCGPHEELRSSRKDPKLLQDLITLREMP